MAEVPILNRADFLNRIIHVLGKDLQPWKFIEPTAGIEEPPYCLSVRFLQTRINVDIYFDHGWGVDADDKRIAERLTGMLRGLVCDDSGSMVQP